MNEEFPIPGFLFPINYAKSSQVISLSIHLSFNLTRFLGLIVFCLLKVLLSNPKKHLLAVIILLFISEGALLFSDRVKRATANDYFGYLCMQLV